MTSQLIVLTISVLMLSSAGIYQTADVHRNNAVAYGRDADLCQSAVAAACWRQKAHHETCLADHTDNRGACGDPPSCSMECSGTYVDYEMFAPKFVLDAASAYADVLPEPDDKAQIPAVKDRARRRFVREWFEGFVSPETTRVGLLASKGGDAFAAGRTFRRKEPDSVSEIMNGYGYRVIKAEGDYVVGFEISKFSPNSKPQENWWLNFLNPSALPALPESSQSPSMYHYVKTVVSIEGFLSPDCVDQQLSSVHLSGHGHMGGYGCDMYVTRLAVVQKTGR